MKYFPGTDTHTHIYMFYYSLVKVITYYSAHMWGD